MQLTVRTAAPGAPDKRASMRGSLLIVGLFLLLAQAALFAQTGSGSITGTVVDKTGAVVPNAKVVVKNTATNALRDTTTNGAGDFGVPALQPGTYSISVTSAGMANYERTGIVLTQGNTVGLPTITMQIAATEQQVEVVGAGEILVPTDTPQTSQTLNQKMVEDLAIVGRDAAELMKIMPGMAMATGLGQGMWNSYTTASNTGPIGAFSANGTQPNGALTMTSDGANLLDPGNQGTQTANINQNQVAEVSLLTSAYGAEFAKGPITFQAYGKSGSAQFHGQAYLYTRNGVFNSVDSYTKNQGGTPITDSFYYPGGDIGGPVIIPGTRFNKNHDKLFFYGAFEYMKQQPAGSLQNYFIPTSQMLQGNFTPAYLASLGPGFASAHSEAAVVPCGSGQNGCSSLSFPGGMIPQTALDPNSLIYASTFPKTNANPASNTTGADYQYFLGPPQNRWETRVRLDYNISDKTKLFVSWNHQHENDLSPISVWWWAGGSLPYPSPQAAVQISQVYSANLVHVFSPTLTNEVVFADAKFTNPVILNNPDAVNPSKLGFKSTGLFSDPFTPQLPNVFGWNNGISGYFAYQYGEGFAPGGANSFGKLSNTPNISDNLTWIKGKHTLKAGFYWDFAQNNQVAGGGQSGGPNGTAEFENWGATTTGNPTADFLIAHATQFTQQNGGVIANFKYYQYSFYVSDQIKASRRLTLTVGVRADHMGNWVPDSGPGLAVWNPATYNGTSAWTGELWNKIDPKIPMSGFPSRAFFPEPRFGGAYDLFGNGKTVLRGGIGEYRYQLAYNSVSGDAFADPLNVPVNTTTWGCCVGWNNFSAFSPATGTAGSGSAPGGVLAEGDDKTPYTWTFNFTLSQRAPWHSVAEIQYTGNRTRDAMLHGPLSNVDLIPYGAFFKTDPKTGVVNDPYSTSFPTADYYPYPFYTGMTLVGHGSYANYNGLIATWQKQAGRVTFMTNYTFSKVLGVRDNQTDNGQGDGNTLWPFALRPNYGVLNYDHTQIFNAAYVVNLPSPVKGKDTGSKFLGGLVNGWVASGITQLQSGAPIQGNTGGTLNASFGCVNHTNPDGSITCAGYDGQNQLGTSSVSLVPRVTCDPRSGLKSGQYFNTNCFAPPLPGSQGDVIWPYIHGPHFFNSDLSIYKRFAIKENKRLEFRFSAFNFLNHPNPQFATSGNTDVNLNFANANGTLAQSNQNALTTGTPLFTVGRRVVEFMAKFNF
jgi:hypothetical protein